MVVVAHPCDDSLTHAAAEAARRGFEQAGHDVTVLDLYDVDFNARMSNAERTAYSSGQPLLDDQARAHAEIVLSAETLVFVYPTWWGGLPAILQGWLERVLVPGVAFQLEEGTKRVRPALKQVKHIVGISTYGSPWIYVKLLTDAGRRVITRALRMTAGWRTSTTWLALYHVDRSDDAVRAAFLRRVEDTAARLS